MKIKKELQLICTAFGEKTGGHQSTWEEIQSLGVIHSVGAVVRDFTAWMEENRGDDFPYGAVPVYLRVAKDRLASDSAPTAAAIRSPEVSNLVRELAYRSKGQISFMDKHKIRLAEVLEEFTAAEITAAFSAWFEEQDLSDPKNVSYLPHQFVQKADQLCYTLRKQREEQERSKIARDAAAKRLQEEAEATRRQAELERAKEEENEFDPFG